MTKSRIVGIALALGLLTASATSFALNNDLTSVQKVEAAGGGLVYIHLATSMRTKPGCAAYQRIIACRLSSSFCEPAMKIALAANLSGKKIEFQTNGSCVSSTNRIAMFDRLRIAE